jgi:hypothetical protein
MLLPSQPNSSTTDCSTCDISKAAKTGTEALEMYSGKPLNCPNPACLKLVVVDDVHLEAGMLFCRECWLTVEICGDEVAAAAYKFRITSTLQTSI